MKGIQITPLITSQNEASVFRYFKDLERLTPLKSEEEFELAKQIRAGDKAALDKLVSANLRFVISVAKKHMQTGRSLADLISEGNIGLIEAAERFDETKGFRFVTFAIWYIRRAMLRSNANNERMLRLPMNLVQGISDINTSREILMKQLEREPEIFELANHSGLTEDKVRDMLKVSLHTSSLDQPVQEENGKALIDFIRDENWSEAELFSADSLRIEVKRVLRILNERERNVLEHLYGLGTGPAIDIEDLAAQLGLCREAVRLIKLKALKRVSKMVYSKRLLEYL